MLCTNVVTQGVTTGVGQAMPSNVGLLNDPTPDERSQGKYHGLAAYTLPKVGRAGPLSCKKPFTVCGRAALIGWTT